MSYLKFDKNQLINLEYSLSRELLRTNRAGSYGFTTIVGCNTRKYHGLFVAPQPLVDQDNHVLLSTLDETVIQHDAEFNLAIHKFKGDVYVPKGHKYIRDFDCDPIPKLTYRVGGVVLTKETLFTARDEKAMIRYTLVDAHSPTRMRFRPFLAFRNIHRLTKANYDADTRHQPIGNGIKIKLYPGYSFLHLQFSKQVDYVHVPDWYFNFEYIREKERGYDYLEDLFTPGYFETSMEKGESLIFCAALEEVNAKTLKRRFDQGISSRIPRDSFYHCMINSAQQFIVTRGKKSEIIAGFPWFGKWGRDTFIALPGLTLTRDDTLTFKAVLDNILKELKGPLFPNFGQGHEQHYNSVDASLWFFWSLQQYLNHSKDPVAIWYEYGKKMKTVLRGYRVGTMYNIRMQENGLLYAGVPGLAITWMDAIINGKPVNPRIGLPVEVNALWYNAIMFALELARSAGDDDFLTEWQPVADRIPQAFLETFYSVKKGYMADYVDGDYKDFSVRPNMLFVASLPYSPVDEEIRKRILDIIERELLTPRGLRTLSPQDPNYHGIYYGDQTARDLAYHNGTVFPWLFGHYAEAYLRLHGKSGVSKIRAILGGFEDVMDENGIGTIPEVYDGDPPHKPGGAISQAWSVAELLRVGKMLREIGGGLQ
ncbi:MAG: amylo-alpha-1,6-glucosidase [Bacteroidales bacterium]|nr:amylo-alpha-1,6-glucosidase [Bacteroidales bacterium]